MKGRGHIRADAQQQTKCWNDVLLRTQKTRANEVPNSESPVPIIGEQLRQEFVGLYFAAPAPLVLRETSSPGGFALLDKADREAFEDYLREIVDDWTAEEQATVYWYLYACGMNLHKAMTIRRKAGLSP